MRFPLYFKRDKTLTGNPAIGSDVAPTFASNRQESAAGTPWANGESNILTHKLQFDRPTNRLVVGYWFSASNPVTIPITVWMWDSKSEKWYEAATGTLTSGQLTYLRIPYLADPPQTQALNPNMDVPNQGIVAMLVIADNSSPTGTIHIVAGPDSAIF